MTSTLGGGLGFVWIDRFDRTPASGEAARMENAFEERMKRVEALARAVTVTDRYISVNGKRIADVQPALNRKDVVTRRQLDVLEGKLAGAIRVGEAFEVTGDSVNVIGGRRIGTCAPSKESSDVLVKAEIEAHRLYLTELQTQLNDRLSTLQTQINVLAEIVRR